MSEAAALEARSVSKAFDAVAAVQGVSLEVPRGAVTCLLGDNGAGKSTLIKILTGVHAPDRGEVAMDGEPIKLRSPRDALDRGIACVYQDLSMIPLMPVARNFFLGREPLRGFGPFKWVDWRRASRLTEQELRRVGIELRNPGQAVGTLSGGERQSLAIARAVYFGARVLVLDEPTAALGVKEAALVLELLRESRERGLAVLLITHNVAHAEAVGDRFVVLNHGRELASLARGEASREELQDLMAGGPDLDRLSTTESSDRRMS